MKFNYIKGLYCGKLYIFLFYYEKAQNTLMPLHLADAHQIISKCLSNKKKTIKVHPYEYENSLIVKS